MKTDELIEALAVDVEPVDPRAAHRRLLWVALVGMLAALPLMLWLLGLNPHLVEAARAPMFWVKFAYVAAIVAAALVLFLRLARPAAEPKWAAIAVALPVVAVWLLAAIALIDAAPGERAALVLGSSWRTCSLRIAALSLPALALTLWAMRELAPTRLRLAGAGAGLLAGALGAFVYLFHCPEFAAPFLAVWYLLGILAPAALGALIGPRLLAW
jgi:hypothetical protein